MTLDDATVPTGDPRGRWHARGHLTLAGGVIIAYLVLPPGATAQAWLFVGLHVATVAAVVLGIRLHRPERPEIWWTLVAGHVLYGLANVAWYLGPEVFGWVLPFPSWADALYIAGYVLIGVGLWRLALARSRHRSGAAATEVAVVTLGLGAVAWLFLMAPYATDDQLSLVTKLVALAYPGFAVMFVSILAGLLILPGRRPRAFLLLALAVGSTLAADTAYAVTTLEGTFAYGTAYMAPWLAYFGLLGAAALDPTMPRLSLPADEEAAESTWRPWALPIALAIPLVTLAYDQWSAERYAQIPVSLALAVAVLLVALRQARLLREVAQRAEAQASLVAGRDAALQASQMKSDFLATMSHEIRTPMNAVIGMSGLLMDTELAEEQERYASGIRTAGEALMALINDVLDFSKIEAGKLELEDTDFDLEGTVEEVADLFSGSASLKNVLIYSYLHPDVPRAVRADAGRLRQVLVNLVNNAVKFTDEGRIIVRVRNAQPTDETAVLRFEVVDSGVGIPEDKQQHLFEVFTQADASSTRRYGGTGLGLAICRQLVRLMGGEIGVESTPGEGSTFWFTMPVRPLVSERDDRWLRPLDGIRVLVVDDDDVNREIVEGQTRTWGMEPTSASNADDAMRMIASATDDHPFRLVLLDLFMPDIDGLELARRITNDPRFEDVQVVLLTSVDSSVDERAAAGVHAHLRKPVRQSQLYDVLMSLLMPDRWDEASDTTSTAPLGPTDGTGTVLLVEDNPANQLVGARILEKIGHNVDVVSDGREALDALGRRHYDAVLMDCQMPVMDGYEATRRLRRREVGGRRTPVIAMTAGVTIEDRHRCLEAGMDDFLPKPVRPETVAATLGRWMRGTPEPEWVASTTRREAPDEEDAGAIIDPQRWQTVLELVGDDPTVLDQLVTSFVDDVPVQLNILRDAVAAGDAERADTASHRVKGSAMNLGATHLADLARRAEEEARGGDLTALADLVDQIDQQADRVITELRGRVAE